MKKYFILFLLSLVIWGCQKEDVFINEFTFYIDGVYYELNTLEIHLKGGGYIKINAFGVEGFRYSPSSPIDSLFYYFVGYNVNTRANSAYGGQFLDRSVQKERFFNVPDPSIDSYFWIRIGEGLTYDAISGYIEMINNFCLFQSRYYTDAISGYIEMINNTDFDKRLTTREGMNFYKAHGTFDFVMVNRENSLDTIHVKNGKFRYQCYAYSDNVKVY